MAETALYRKWRSQTFADLVGQEHVSRTLLNALAKGRVGHAYLFCGPRGVGKTSVARLLAKAINCETNEGRGEPCNHCRLCREIGEGRCLDVLEIDAASNTSVEHIRDLRDKIQYTPSEARFKVYIIDEVHRLSPNAFDALLKTLEEPPAHAKFMFASTERHKIPATILSRCQRFDLRRIPLRDVAAHLAAICDAEGIAYEPAALELVARAGTGSMRDSISLLDQLRSMAVDSVTLADTQALLGVGGTQGMAELAAALADRDVAAILRTVDRLSGEGVDLRQLAADLIEHLRALLLLRTGSGADMLDFSQDARTELEALAPRFDLGDLVRALKLLNDLDLSPRTLTGPQVPLELALIEAALGEMTSVSMPAAAPPARSAPSEWARPPANAGRSADTAAPAPSTPSLRPTAPSRPAVTSNGSGSGRSADTDATETAASVGARSSDAPEPAGPVQNGLSVEEFASRWQTFLERGLSNGRVKALLVDARPCEWDGSLLVLGFKTAHYPNLMTIPSNQTAAEEALTAFYGTPVQIRARALAPTENDDRSSMLQDPVVKHGLAHGARVKRVVRHEEG